MGWFGKFGGWDYCAGFGKYLWWNGKEVLEEEGEESFGNRMGPEFLLGLKKFLGQMVVQLKNSLKLSRKMN